MPRFSIKAKTQSWNFNSWAPGFQNSIPRDGYETTVVHHDDHFFKLGQYSITFIANSLW